MAAQRAVEALRSATHWNSNAEVLEPRMLLSLTPVISGADHVVTGTAYVLSLSATDGAGAAASPASWTIDWGDGNTQHVSGSPATVSHGYPVPFSTRILDITATASDGSLDYAAHEAGGSSELPVTVPGSGIKGDFNQDGSFDGNDTSAFLGAVSDPTTYLAAHPYLNSSDLVTLGDFGGALDFQGNFNRPDGNFDGFDLDAFLLALNDPTAYAAAQVSHVKGDFNQDGSFDGNDTSAFLGAVSDPTTYLAAHPYLNSSDLVTLGDFGGALDLQGNFNRPDGNFDGFDLDAFLLALNDPTAYTAAQVKGDFNQDGTFDAHDICPFVRALSDPTTYLAAYPYLSSPDLVTLGDFGGAVDLQSGFNRPDGAFDGFDLDAFLLALNDPTAYAAAQVVLVKGDFNQDGTLDLPDADTVDTALQDPSLYQSQYPWMTTADILSIGDLDDSGVFDAADETALWDQLGVLTVNPPSGLSETGLTDSGVGMAWADNSSNEAHFVVQRSADGSSWADLATLPADQTSFADDSLTADTAYYYRVLAVNTYGGARSAASNVLAAHTLPTTTNAVTASISNGSFQSVTYNGTTYFSSTSTIFETRSTDMSGDDQQSLGNAVSSTWNGDTGTLVTFYPGCTLTMVLSKASDRISWDVTITNTTSDRIINGYNWMQSPISFASWSLDPAGVDGIDGLQAIRAADGANALELVNETTGKLRVTQFREWGGHVIRVGTMYVGGVNPDEGSYPAASPQVFIQPGSNDHFKVSLRFAPIASPTSTMVSDQIYNTRLAQPFELGQWADRRVIGAYFLSAGELSADTSTPAGVSAYQSELLAKAQQLHDDAVTNDLQGVIFWDIEGNDQYNNHYSYAGDPRILSDVNPYFDSIADEFFSIVERGSNPLGTPTVKVGFLLRDQTLVENGNGIGYTQTESADPTTVLEQKICYTVNRWGASLFYVDSNSSADPTPFIAAHAMFPDVLLIPENGTGSGFYAAGAEYQDARHDPIGTPDNARAVYPRQIYPGGSSTSGAFSAIWVGDSPLPTSSSTDPAFLAAVLAAAEDGDILIAHVLYGAEEWANYLANPPT